MHAISLTAVLPFVSLLSFCASPALSTAHERLAALPNGWDHIATPDDSITIILQIGLQEQNIDQLEPMLFAISTPGNPKYGDFMEADAVNALLKPSGDSEKAVLDWLRQAGITRIYSDGTWVNFATTIATAKKLLNTQFNYYTSEGITKLRTTEYSVPESLKKHIDLISPTTFFGKTKIHAPMTGGIAPRQVDASCDTLITPQCLKQLYNINYTPDPKSGSRIAFGSFVKQSVRTADLRKFQKKYKLPRQGFSVELINGGTNNQAKSAHHGEANLDVEYIVGVSQPLPVISYITGESLPFKPNLDESSAAYSPDEPYVDYFQYLLSKENKDLPQVISHSYGDDEPSVPKKYARRVCNMIGQLGLRGITVVAASGDTGVGARCLSNDGKMAPRFTPVFPSTCPYITAVGGTQSISPEVAWNASSGGFSDYFRRPSYQNSAVSAYLSDYIPKATLKYFEPFFKVHGRAFPDVSAHSLYPPYSVVVNHRMRHSGGTSAAAPVFASIVALLNDARLGAGKKQLGFLNPWLYSVGFKGLTDITAGGAVGCNGINGQTHKPVSGANGIIPHASWNATVGWDPVTGLGVPDFEKLIKLAMA